MSRRTFKAAISFLVNVPETDAGRIGLAGYSAGAGFAFPVGVGDGRIKALAAISPPLSMFRFDSLKECLKPKLLTLGSQDDFVPTAQFRQFCRALPEPKECLNVEGADHFWWGFEANLADKVSAFFARALTSGAG